MKTIILTTIIAFLSINLIAQVAINDDGTAPNASAMLDVKSSDKGLLIPRLTTTQRNSLASTAVAGLMVYDTDESKFFFFNGVTWDEGSTGGLWSRSGSVTYLSNYNDGVGIGTLNPSQDLDIVDSTSSAFLSIRSLGGPGYAGIFIDKDQATNNSYIVWQQGGANKWYTGLIHNNDFAISKIHTSADGTFIIKESGNVGIGTTVPGANLEVKNTGAETELRISRPNNTYASILTFYTGTDNMWNIGAGSGSSNMILGRGAGNSTGDLSLMYNGGNVGIGTTSPLGNLHIHDDDHYATIYLTPSVLNDSSALFLGEDPDGTYGMIWKYDGSDNQLQLLSKVNSSYFGPHISVTRQTGRVGIGIAAPTYPFHLVTNGTIASSVFEQGGTGELFKGYGPNGGNEEIAIGNDGMISIYNSNHNKTIQIDPSETGTDDGGQITLWNAGGTVATIEIDGSYSGDGRITTNELQITGGSDLSEFFDLTDYGEIRKGMVVSIDENNPGYLTISEKAYDRKVAGIVSGANDIEPGLIMSQKGTIADGEHLIALSGRVYCLVDASDFPVEIGDMLTTSNVPGYAMKVVDFDEARGAIIGKAMTSLKSGEGMVLVLVSLQ